MYNRERVIDSSGNLVQTKDNNTGPTLEERITFLNGSVSKIMDDPGMGRLMKEGALEALNMNEEELQKFPKVCELLGRIVEDVAMDTINIPVDPTPVEKDVLIKVPINETLKSSPPIKEPVEDTRSQKEKIAAEMGHILPNSSNRGISQEDMEDRNNRINRPEVEDKDEPGMVTSTMPDSAVQDKYEPVDDV